MIRLDPENSFRAGKRIELAGVNFPAQNSAGTKSGLLADGREGPASGRNFSRIGAGHEQDGDVERLAGQLCGCFGSQVTMKFVFGTVLTEPLNERQRAQQSQPGGAESGDKCVVGDIVQKINAQSGELLAGFGREWPGELNQEKAGSIRIEILCLARFEAFGGFRWDRLIAQADEFCRRGGSREKN